MKGVAATAVRMTTVAFGAVGARAVCVGTEVAVTGVLKQPQAFPKRVDWGGSCKLRSLSQLKSGTVACLNAS